MSPYRIADAARISPYPRTNPAEEHPDAASSSVNLASASSTGSAGGSPSKARLMAEAAAAAAANNNGGSRSARNADRSVAGNGRQGQQVEERFNVGAPKKPKASSRRNWRGARSGRAILEGIDEGVPNYPPPSFQEAIAASSSSTLAQSSSSMSMMEHSPVRATAPATEYRDQSENEFTTGRVSPPETPSASESEDSLEIVPPPPRGRDQRVEFPPYPSPSSPDTSISPSSDSQLSRGRAKSKMASVLHLSDSDEHEEYEPEPDPGLVRSSTKKRFLSLSPLRTLFPPKQHKALQSRALSAHPPGTSPYSTPRSTHFFRSTTSLASSSVLRFPSFGASTLTLTANNSKRPDDVKSVSGKSSRKLFASMSREKEKQRSEDECSDDESFEAWEVLGHDGEVESQKESWRIDSEPRSLMAMIVQKPDLPPPTVMSPAELSPARSLSFTYGVPVTPTALSPLASPINSPSSSAPSQPQPPPPSPPTQTASSWTEPHPLSLRDRKVQEAIQPFLNRKVGKDRSGHHRSKTAPSPIVVPPSSGAGPPVTRVRTRMNQVLNNSDQNAQQPTATEAPAATCVVEAVAPPAPGMEERREISGAERGIAVDEANILELQRALDTPLPSSPVHTTSFPSSFTPPLHPRTSVSSSPASVIINISSPTTPVPARGGVVLSSDGGGKGSVQPSSLMAPTLNAGVMIDTPTPVKRPEIAGCVCKHHPAPLLKATVTPSSVVDNSLRRSPPPSIPSAHPQKHLNITPVMSSTPRAGDYRRHYQGRPLPRPPPYAPQPQPPSRNAVVDSIYAGHEAFPSSGSPNTTIVPEGLLIDLENDDDPDMSGFWTPPLEDHSYQQMHLSSGSTTPHRASPIGSLRSSPEHSIRSLPLSFSSANVSSLSGLSEMTDLEILAATLEDGNNHDGGGGADYETLLLISEFLGPADEARVSNVNMGSDASTESNVSLTGRVEVQRRRVTADGRVKLKMNVLGVPVSRCGICISQFREGQYGSMSLSCQHIFHENCLRQWLVRSKTCPLCRISLDSGNS